MLTPLAQLNRLHTCGSIMAEKLDPKELVTIEELAISTMWETSALPSVRGEGFAFGAGFLISTRSLVTMGCGPRRTCRQKRMSVMTGHTTKEG